MKTLVSLYRGLEAKASVGRFVRAPDTWYHFAKHGKGQGRRRKIGKKKKERKKKVGRRRRKKESV